MLYFDNYFSAIYFILGYLCFIYKGYGLFYPPGNLAVEVISLTLFLIWQYIRIDLGVNGNKTENPKTMAWFIILTVPAVLAMVYFITLQTYVLMLEVVINAVGIGFLVLEFFLSLTAIVSFRSYEKNQ